MKALKLGEVEDFPFLEAPSARAIADGYQLLGELNAVDEQRRLTPIGSQLAKLPIDPRMARMIVAARDEGCLVRDADHRERARHPGSARASARAPGARRYRARAVPRRALRVCRPAQDLGVLRRGAQAQEVQPQARAGLLRAFPVVSAVARVARSARTAACAGLGDGLASEREAGQLRGGASCAAGGSARQYRQQVGRSRPVSGCARHQVRHLPGLAAAQETAAVADVRRAHRDHTPLCALCRGDRCGMARARRRASGEEDLPRPALGKECRARRWHSSASPCTGWW